MGDRLLLEQEFKRHQGELNKSFLGYLESGADPLAIQLPAALDYEFYSNAIGSRYGHQVRGTGVFSFGTGDCGQLGHGISDPPLDDEVVMPLAKKIASLTSEMRILASGGLSNAVCTPQGVLTWGCNDGEALGRDGDENLPAPIHFPIKIVVVGLALGDSHGSAVSLGGQAFLWGSYRDKEGKQWFPELTGSGKLTGPGASGKTPQLVPSLSNLTKVCSGANHTVFLDGQGQVFSCGLGEQYQLGRGDIKVNLKDKDEEYILELVHGEHLQPRKVPLDFFCIQIGCGQYHTLLVSQDLQVFGCGLNQYRQVCPRDEAMVKHPVHIPSLDGLQITEVGGGEHFSYACSARSGMYTWGRSDQNQLGRQVSSQVAGACEEAPRPVQNLPKDIKQVSCGSSHAIVCTKQGKVYTWGFGESYQLGHGDTRDEPLPKLVAKLQGQHAIQVSAGGQHCCVLVDSA